MTWRDVLPYESYAIPVSVAAGQLERRINDAAVRWRNWRITFFWSRDAGKFESDCTSVTRSFRVRRIIAYRNSFLPTGRCVLEAGESGTVLRVVVRMSLFTEVFTALWFSMLVVGSSVLVLSVATNSARAKSPIGLLALPLMFLFAGGLVLGAFKSEAVKLRRFLEEVCAEEPLLAEA